MSVEDLIKDVIEQRRDELTREGFAIEVDVEPSLPEIMGDPRWLKGAMDNLLNNAAKYSTNQRWVGLNARYSCEGREVLITVADRGMGIDRGDFDQIFEPFTRGRRAVEAQIAGSGIGLSLVRSALDAHRGKVTFESELGRGSSFTLHPLRAKITETLVVL
jgi:two-component system, OmpR family, sensor histidine kinase SenX3